MTTQFTNIKIVQQQPYALPTSKVQVSFTLVGTAPNLVQIYAQQAGSQAGNLIAQQIAATITWKASTPTVSTTISLQAGSAYSIYLCPRNETSGTLEDQYNGGYWEASCTLAGNITTKVPDGTVAPATKPVISKIDPEPATLTGDNSFTVSWTSTQYDKFLVWWTIDGQSLAQGEISSPGISGSWTTNQPCTPGAQYTFAVEGGTGQGLTGGYNWSGWGPTVDITAVQNLRSLVQLLKKSGVNPAGLSVKSIMGAQTSLKSVMKLT
jgi:hypothetical protein